MSAKAQAQPASYVSRAKQWCLNHRLLTLYLSLAGLFGWWMVTASVTPAIISIEAMIVLRLLPLPVFMLYWGSTLVSMIGSNQFLPNPVEELR